MQLKCHLDSSEYLTDVAILRAVSFFKLNKYVDP